MDHAVKEWVKEFCVTRQHGTRDRGLPRGFGLIGRSRGTGLPVDRNDILTSFIILRPES